MITTVWSTLQVPTMSDAMSPRLTHAGTYSRQRRSIVNRLPAPPARTMNVSRWQPPDTSLLMPARTSSAMRLPEVGADDRKAPRRPPPNTTRTGQGHRRNRRAGKGRYWNENRASHQAVTPPAVQLGRLLAVRLLRRQLLGRLPRKQWWWARGDLNSYLSEIVPSAGIHKSRSEQDIC